MSILKNDWLVLIIRIVVGGFFAYAALDKIANPADFAKIVHNYRVLPGSLVNVFAIFLPWLELLIGMALIVGTRVAGASAIATGLMVVFIVAVASAIARGIKIDCGCFSTTGDGARQVGLPLIIQDVVLLALSIFVWIRGAGRWSVDGTASIPRVANADGATSQANV